MDIKNASLNCSSNGVNLNRGLLKAESNNFTTGDYSLKIISASADILSGTYKSDTSALYSY